MSACRTSTPALVEQAVKLATEPLVNNQIECHPYFDQTKTIAASHRHGLSVTAYSPIARGRARATRCSPGSARRMARPRPRSACATLSSKIWSSFQNQPAERLKENLAIFDFTLMPAEMKEIAALASPHGNIVS